ncbi:uncharacterized protein PV09_05229 [Verruconis gallopava]|uniref:Extracellular membrane protein CFEM domain-containing protein n=1 Tax=Verruconis gallopava TaxID=253628 RepID=A0A0D2AA67_9PEZI|nr:uncharacterized protein PV09_05229 [Verruconis gallopava]KIW03460.1 hypothetical protein PV09_05229 [Verruconis gallopava]
MGGERRRKRSSAKPRRLRIINLLLSWPTLVNAVALSDFTPKITNLSPSCQTAYTTTIPGCKVSDFTNAAHTCSSACLNGLVQINALVNQNCQNDDVSETSIIGLFLLGQAIQLLCNVDVVTKTTGLTQGGSATPASNTIPPNTFITYSSTMTMSVPPSTASPAASIISSTAQISSLVSQTLSATTQSRPMPSASDGMIGNTPTAPLSTSSSISSSTKTGSTTTSTTSINYAAEESQRSGNVDSGGGSPFDNIDNSEAIGLRALISTFGTVAIAFSIGALLSVS